MSQQAAAQANAAAAEDSRAEEHEALARLKQELQQRQQDLDHHQRVIDQQRLDLEARLEKQSAASREWEQRTTERQAALEAEQQSLETAESQLEAERERLAAEGQQLDADRAELARLQEQLAAEREALSSRESNRVQEPSRHGADAPSASDEEAGDESPDDDRIFDRLNRIAHGGAAKDDDAAEQVAHHATEEAAEETNETEVQVSDAYARFQQRVREEEQAETPAPAASTTAPATAPAGDEESIEDYMARLMRRVRGEAGDPSPLPAQPVRRPAPCSEPAATAEPAEAEEEECLTATADAVASARQAAVVPTGPVELVARAKAPEVNELSRMREVANLQARSAIDKSMRKRTASEIANKWVIVGVGILMSGAMAFMGWHGNRIALLGMCAGLATSLFYALQATWSVKGLFAGRTGKKHK